MWRAQSRSNTLRMSWVGGVAKKGSLYKAKARLAPVIL